MNVEELNSRLIITSGVNLVTFDPASGRTESVKVPPPDLPPNLTKGQLEVLNKEDRTINSVAISRDRKYIAVSTENKQIVVYDASLNLKKNFIVNRTASKVVFTTSGDILVADRTGDVFLYKFDGNSEPTLLLGHLSMILDMVLSGCGKYIVTCDRDEKIRVSRFPNTYNIVSYCLGHEEFVTTVKIVRGILVSASGDGTVRIWDYLKGQELNVINTNHYVCDVSLLQQFSDEMDKEKVDVTALPITDMQIYSSDDNCVFIAVSLLSYSAVQFYKLTLETYKWGYIHNIQSLETPHKFYLSSKLYIFDNCKCVSYKLENDSYNLETESSQIGDFYKDFKHILKITDNCITVLYKRKFDNVQEYINTWFNLINNL